MRNTPPSGPKKNYFLFFFIIRGLKKMKIIIGSGIELYLTNRKLPQNFTTILPWTF
jgi:hypothetical protein